jgi:hypothetical protein
VSELVEQHAAEQTDRGREPEEPRPVRSLERAGRDVSAERLREQVGKHRDIGADEKRKHWQYHQKRPV